MAMARTGRPLWVSVSSIALLASCEPVVRIGDRPPPVDAPAPPIPPLEILFVVDNSGSMAEEQAALARTIFKPECPVRKLDEVPAALQNPDSAALAELATVCGVGQMLAVTGVDFRIGVITTDVDACEYDFGEPPPPRPQRGCLQAVPSTGEKVLAANDAALGEKFAELIGALGQRGAVERAFDAVQLFYAGETWDDRCRDDLALLHRRGARLVLIFISDEDDCSHLGAPDIEDLATEDCGSLASAIFSQPSCYTAPELLNDTTQLRDWVTTMIGAGELDPRVAVAAVVGAAIDGTPAPQACLVDDLGVVTTECFASFGNSAITVPGSPCAPGEQEQPCCTADAAGRYVEAILELGRVQPIDARIAPICSADFTRPIVEIIKAAVTSR